MTTSEDRLVILKLIEEGRISADEGARLLKALGGDSRPSEPPAPPVLGGRHLRVTVTDTATGQLRVNVRLPLGLADTLMRLGTRFVPSERLADLDDVVEAVRTGATGQVLDVLDADAGNRVEVFVD